MEEAKDALVYLITPHVLHESASNKGFYSAMATLFVPLTAACEEFSKWTSRNRNKLSHERQRPAAEQ
jgi:hypothetical protein